MQIPSIVPLILVALAPVLSAQDGEAKVDFIKQVLPILQARCIECHGPKDQEADLRLDRKAGLFVADRDDWVVLPGNHEESEFYVRISLPADDEDIMPSEGEPLSKAEIELLRRWIAEGANWPEEADAIIAKQLAASAPKIEKLELPKLSKADLAREAAAMQAVSKAGGLAMRIAASSLGSEVNLSLMGDKAGNAQLQLAADLANSLVRLDLSRTKVDDAGLAAVESFKQLRWLNLSRTAVTDAGLDSLAGLAHLRYLNLYGTEVTDAGLARLSGLKSLRKLFLWQSKASKKGVAALRQAVPGLKVDMGEYAAVLASIKPAKTDPINKNCPVSGKPVDPSKTSVFQGQVIGLCCDKCKKKFDQNPAACIGKVKEFKPARGEVAVNQKCPVSGEPVVAGCSSPFRGKVIGFCCKKCKAKFDQDPAKFLAKLKGVFEK